LVNYQLSVSIIFSKQIFYCKPAVYKGAIKILPFFFGNKLHSRLSSQPQKQHLAFSYWLLAGKQAEGWFSCLFFNQLNPPKAEIAKSFL